MIACLLAAAGSFLYPSDKSPTPLPTPEKPIQKTDAAGRKKIRDQWATMLKAAPTKMRPHPAAAGFPGNVPADAIAVSRDIAIDLATPRWHSTGLYAVPGKLVTIRAPDRVVNKNFSVQIGAHSDQLWKLDHWERYPAIVLRFPIAHPVIQVANPFGGLIYVDVPASAEGPEVQVSVEGAVEAPQYRLNHTTQEEWAVSRWAPGPWAEIGSGKFILTVPSAVVRTLDNPWEVARFWDEVFDADAALAVVSKKARSPERLVFDQQISEGILHSGYPMMGPTSMAQEAVNVTYLRSQRPDEDSRWGFLHEIGHGFQRDDWTFDGTEEVTVNLFTLYALEAAAGIPVNSNYRGSLAFRKEQMAKYDFAKPDFRQWKRDPFLALVMFLQLQQAFGWDSYKAVFAGYTNRSFALDGLKRDQFMVRFSRAVGRNLGPFFTAWGIPTSPLARRSIADLPCWAPAELPVSVCPDKSRGN